MFRLFNQNAQTGLDLLGKTLDATRTNGDAGTRIREIWDQAPGAARANTETILQMNTRLVECWGGVAKAAAGQTAASD